MYFQNFITAQWNRTFLCMIELFFFIWKEANYFDV